MHIKSKCHRGGKVELHELNPLNILSREFPKPYPKINLNWFEAKILSGSLIFKCNILTNPFLIQSSLAGYFDLWDSRMKPNLLLKS